MTYTKNDNTLHHKTFKYVCTWQYATIKSIYNDVRDHEKSFTEISSDPGSNAYWIIIDIVYTIVYCVSNNINRFILRCRISD